MQKKRDVIVTCSDEQGCVAKVANSLRDTGFEVESVLEFAGSVVGKWQGDLTRLKEIPGVTDVSESEEKFA